MWHRLDWNPIDGWGGASRTGSTRWEPAPRVGDAHDLVRQWVRNSLSSFFIIHEDVDLIIYLGFYQQASDRSGIAYLTIWKDK